MYEATGVYTITSIFVCEEVVDSEECINYWIQDNSVKFMPGRY